MKGLLIAVILLSGVVFAKGGGGGGGGGGPGGGGGGGGKGGPGGVGGSVQNRSQSQSQNQTEQPQSSDPAQMVTTIMASYDENNDDVLSLDELTQAMGAIQKQKSSQGGQSGQRSESLAADKAAAQMIEKYSSDQKGLTADELTKALKEQRSNGNSNSRSSRK